MTYLLYFFSHHHFHPQPLFVVHRCSQVAVYPDAVVKLTVWMRVATEPVLFAYSESALEMAAVRVINTALTFHHVALKHSSVLERVHNQQISFPFCHIVMKGSLIDLPAVF